MASRTYATHAGSHTKVVLPLNTGHSLHLMDISQCSTGEVVDTMISEFWHSGSSCRVAVVTVVMRGAMTSFHFGKPHLAIAIPQQSNAMAPQETIRPFAPPASDTYTCPFKAQGEACKSSSFKGLKGVAAHCKQKHTDRVIVPFDDDPTLQDGTCRIPCVKRCGSLFSTYDASMQHAKKCNATEALRSCAKPGCVEPTMMSRAYATHAGSHTVTRQKFPPR
jgi:hypothetical protein